MNISIPYQANCSFCKELHEYVDILKEKLMILSKQDDINTELDKNNYRLIKMMNKRISDLEIALKDQLNINEKLQEENRDLQRQLNEYGEDEVDDDEVDDESEYESEDEDEEDYEEESEYEDEVKN